jgi:hypothetical protein
MCFKYLQNSLTAKMHQMMISCEEASILAGKKEAHELSLGGKMNLKFHLMGCSACRMAHKQFKMISDCLQNGSKKIEEGIYARSLSVQYKSELQELINAKLQTE